MNARAALEYALGGLLLLVVGTLLVGQLLGQPILFGYVETGSMAPTLQPNDGFVAVPPSLAGPIEEGDVITFNAQTLHGGGLTTHRVVEITPNGYITKGDANPVTDQASGEPPVPPERVVAVALQVGGEVVVIPNLGLLVTGVGGLLTAIQRRLAVVTGTRAVLGTQGLAYLLFALGLLAYAASAVFGSERANDRTRSRKRRTGAVDSRLLVAVTTTLIVVLLTGSMVAVGGGSSITIVSSESDAPGPRVIPAGGSENLTYVVPSNGLVPTVAFLEPTSEGVAVAPRQVYVPGNQVRNVTVTLTAPPATGTYTRSFVEHRYLAVLPPATIRSLYGIHPWLPVVVIDLLVGTGFAGVATALVGSASIRVESRSRNVPLWTRIRRWFR